ncbi:dethiobiotin synthase [Hydrogenimonas cancrithermarum]|uniref:ATP-dependent dethiobiotin synthetase BioD n=1 Tax=Hydrogenimonas cancrithermarum TaxID=2993563 RepID=A0ABN6WU28_9BACT|nr:dethiobiotin synthase [Hydrogenimonas cancrithermarum]BDY12595.1 dethiobiotin synthase [Hydrogenimonas cancrithermarum]
MAIKIFVTATNTNVGKTHTTLSMMEEAARQGLRPAAFKPIETGVTDEKPADGTALLKAMHRLNPVTEKLTTNDVVPLQFKLPAAPYVAKGDQTIVLGPVIEKSKQIEALCDILFIEGAGGVMVPIDEGLFMIDLPKLFDAHTLLISPSRLGSINDTLLSMEALNHRGIGFDLAINLFEDMESFEYITLPYYERTGISHSLLPRDLSALVRRFNRLR